MRGHLHELARYVEIHTLHLGEPREILIEDDRYLHVPDLDPVLGQEHEDEGQGSLKILHLIPGADDALQMKGGVLHQCASPSANTAMNQSLSMSQRSTVFRKPEVAPVATSTTMMIIPYRS